MLKTSATTLGLAALLTTALTGCSLLGKKAETSGGGGSAPLADNMHDAPTYQHNATITAPLACNAAGYAKLAVNEGEAFKVDLTTSGPVGACVHVRILAASGSDTNGASFEMCSDKEPTKTLDVTGQTGGTLIELMEDPPCKNAGIKVDIH